MLAVSAPFPDLRIEPIRAALAPRSIGLSSAPGGRGWRILHLASGRGEMDTRTAPVALAAPCLAWAPAGEVGRFRLGAGAVGLHLVLPEEPLANAIGQSLEAAELRAFADRVTAVALGEAPDAASEIARALAVIEREAERREPGATTLIEAQLRIILVHLWRVSAGPAAGGAGEAPGARLLREFRRLVEMRFRDRWTIALYCSEIGITPDRLNHLCVRRLGRPPRDLVLDRLIYEARLMLARSSLSVEQVAAALGFPSAAQFSRLFLSKTGLRPGAFRREQVRAAAEGEVSMRPGYADWP